MIENIMRMRTNLECMSCFLQQALATARLSSNDPEMHRLIVNETGKLISSLDMTLSPPENAVSVYKLIAELSGVADPFHKLKEESNRFALKLRDHVRERIDYADDPLYAAVRFAIAGNIIDYGTQHEFDAMQTLSQCLEQDLPVDDFAIFRNDIMGPGKKNILYLADNCGEIVFDSFLIEQLQKFDHNITLVVRDEVILNDVTRQDILRIGIEDLCPIITNGSSCPGTPLGSCGEDLQKAFSQSDIIISKGQGNFETLSATRGPIYFLLTVKCAVVANHIAVFNNELRDRVTGCGEMILMKMEE